MIPLNMKRVIIFTCVVILFVVWTIYLSYGYLRQSVQEFSLSDIIDRSGRATTAQLPEGSETIDYKNGSLSYYFFITQPEEIRLVENTGDASARELAGANLCRRYVNGGYYTADMNPLGLFIVNGVVLYPMHDSTTLNAIFAVNNSGKAEITEASLNDDWKVALQAGPLLVENGIARNLEIRNDEAERRVIAATLENGFVAFIVLYDADSVYLGPYLKDVPELIVRIASAEGVRLENAMNLDGGTASAFSDGKVFLSEFKTVGSIICIK